MQIKYITEDETTKPFTPNKQWISDQLKYSLTFLPTACEKFQ